MTASDQGCVRAILEGRDHDLQALAHDMTSPEARVEQHGDDWVLISHLIDAAWDKGGEIQEVAVNLLRELDGAARVLHPEHRPSRLTGRYDGPAGSGSMIVLGVAAEEESATCLGAVYMLSDGSAPMPPPTGADLREAAKRNGDLAEALELMGGPDTMSPSDLWKVMEIVRESVGGSIPRIATPALLATRWLTKAEWKSFNAVVHDPEVSGPAARHARHQPSDADPMTLGEARALLSRVVRSWAKTV